MCDHSVDSAVTSLLKDRAALAKPGTVIFPMDCKTSGAYQGDLLRILGTEHRRGSMNQLAPEGCEFVFRTVPVPGGNGITGAYVCVSTETLNQACVPLPPRTEVIPVPAAIPAPIAETTPPVVAAPATSKKPDKWAKYGYCDVCDAGIGLPCLTRAHGIAKSAHANRTIL